MSKSYYLLYTTVNNYNGVVFVYGRLKRLGTVTHGDDSVVKGF